MTNNPNPLGVLGSKCVGEPPLCLSPSVGFAVRESIEAARQEIQKLDYFQLDSPASVDRVQQLCLVDYTQFKLSD
jgi:xanthine dehydrogenase/oxidase